MNKYIQFFIMLFMGHGLLVASSDKSMKSLTLPESIVVGGVAGGIEVVTLGQPLQYAMNTAIRNQGAAKPIKFAWSAQTYQGVGAHAGLQMPILACQKGTQQQLTELVRSRQDQAPLSDAQQAGVSYLSGMAGSLIDTPSNSIQRFLQRPENEGKSTVQACKELSLKGLSRGARPNALCKEGPFVTAYQYGAPKVAEFLQEQGVENKLAATVAGGALVGVATAVITQPAAVINATMQADPAGKVYKNGWQTAQKIYAEQGAAGLFKGLSWRSKRIAGAIPILAVSMTVLESQMKK